MLPRRRLINIVLTFSLMVICLAGNLEANSASFLSSSELAASSTLFANPIIKNNPVVASQDNFGIERSFSESKDVFIKIPRRSRFQRISWEGLRSEINQIGIQNALSPGQMDHARRWLSKVETDIGDLRSRFQSPYSRDAFTELSHRRYVKYRGSLVTPAQLSMWNHCIAYFEKEKPGWTAEIISGYRSPAFETILFTAESGTLATVARKRPLPYYSGHQRSVPDITVVTRFGSDLEQTEDTWTALYESCGEFGFYRVYENSETLKGELRFQGAARLYQPFLKNRFVPTRIKKNLMKAMESTGFYPSPEALAAIMTMSDQESSIQWNPRLNIEKKKYIARRFETLFDKAENSFRGSLTNLLMSAEQKNEKQKIISELTRITDPTNKKIHEYDFYLWTLEVNKFFKDLIQEHKRATRIGQWMFELEKVSQQVLYEPQTFGLWQVNINHLSERILAKPRLRREFPEIFRFDGRQWHIDRHKLVNALSGMSSSDMTKQKTLELLIRTYLQPRYQSHMRGSADDLMYFLAENISGEMSTFRAAIQKELNHQLDTVLVLDGDLTFYKPYSIAIDWNRESNSQKALKLFVQSFPHYFPEPESSSDLIQELCEANDWQSLSGSLLYQRIMGDKAGDRIFPTVKSGLYQQSAEDYAKLIIKRSRYFK